MNDLRVVVVPALVDNYVYLVIDEARRCAAVVDPSDAEPVLVAASRENVRITEIWVTHHHADHTAGIPDLCERARIERVIGSAYDAERRRISLQNEIARPDRPFRFGSHAVRALEVPGHTLGAVAYHVADDLFTGDTLFVAGCGRLFEGTAAQMVDSLRRLRALPDETRVWCGHEYTVANLSFATSLEPSRAALRDALQCALRARAAGQPTVPSTLAFERAYNPFLRFDAPELAAGRDPIATFAALRAAKDRYVPPAL
ncbi:MAG: hydroxyacylglutathione hydrolase [Myxococcota bacterium]|nr:hydroxyacylglutathione hydrolase [Myxococcota bacterium]